MLNPKYVNMFLRKFSSQIKFSMSPTQIISVTASPAISRLALFMNGKDNHPTKLITVQKPLQDEDGFTVEGEEYTN